MTALEIQLTKALGNHCSFTTKTIIYMVFLVQIYVTLFTCASLHSHSTYIYICMYMLFQTYMYPDICVCASANEKSKSLS